MKISKLTAISLTCFLFLSGQGYAGWTTKTQMPTERQMLCSAVVNGKIYVIGGNNLDGYLHVVEEYDPVSDSWTTKAPMPTKRDNLTCNAVNGKIYAIGGYKPAYRLNKVEEYDPADNSWATKAPMPTARNGCCSVAVNGKIYVIGGHDPYDSAKVEVTTL